MYIFPTLRAGALSSGLQNGAPDALAETIPSSASRKSTLHPLIAARVVQEIQGVKRVEQNPATSLSERELEVLHLIAADHTNAEIAQTPIISEKTVKGHVSNILNKLHMLDRTQAAVFTWQQGIVRRSEQ